MRVHETLTGYENELYRSQQLLGEKCNWEEEEYGQCERRYLPINMLDNKYLLEIVRITGIIEHPDIARYTEYIGCAFIRVKEKNVLVVDLRERKTNEGKVNVVITEARLEAKVMLFGFIVDTVEDFYRKVL